MRRFLVSLCLIACAGGDGKAAERLGGFECVAYAELTDVAASVEDLSLNAFVIDETLSRTDLVSSGLKLAFTATNKSDTRLYISADFVLLDGQGLPLIAMNATPPRLFLEKAKTARLDAFTIAPAGTLAEVRRVCMRFYRSAPR